MTDEAGVTKIPSWKEIRERLDMGQPHPITITADPPLQILIEPNSPALALCARAAGVPAGLERPARGIRVQAHAPGLVAVWVDDDALLELGWTFLAGLAASILQGTALLDALDFELQKWRELVLRTATTSVTDALGVLGELAVLRAVIASGRDASAWVGRDGGAIDFRFGMAECEVKTTSGTRHEHFVNGADQLQVSPGARLLIMSLKVAPTETGKGSSVASIVADVVHSGVNGHDLEKALAVRRGVHLADPASLSPYVLRADPLVVDSNSVPAITPDLLTTTLGQQASRIRDVSYRLDLEGLPQSTEWITSEIAAKVML